MEIIPNTLNSHDLRNRLLFTLGCLTVYFLGGHTPVPGINLTILQDAQADGLHLSCNSAFEYTTTLFTPSKIRWSIFGLGLAPYVLAWIILFLLPPLWLHLYRLYKKGASGWIKINQYVRFLAIGLSAFQAYGIAATLNNVSGGDTTFVLNPGFLSIFTMGLTISAGFVLVLWISDQITDRGIGYGTPVLMVASVIMRMLEVASGSNCFWELPVIRYFDLWRWM